MWCLIWLVGTWWWPILHPWAPRPTAPLAPEMQGCYELEIVHVFVLHSIVTSSLNVTVEKPSNCQVTTFAIPHLGKPSPAPRVSFAFTSARIQKTWNLFAPIQSLPPHPQEPAPVLALSPRQAFEYKEDLYSRLERREFRKRLWLKIRVCRGDCVGLCLRLVCLCVCTLLCLFVLLVCFCVWNTEAMSVTRSTVGDAGGCRSPWPLEMVWLCVKMRHGLTDTQRHTRTHTYWN